MRHFEVNCPLPSGWFTCGQFIDWRGRYDLADISPIKLDLGSIPWDHCLSSDLPRAFTTAQAAFKGKIEQRTELRELETGAFQSGNLRLPVSGWRWVYRLAWMANHPSQKLLKSDFLNRIKALAAELVADPRENILVVSHAGTMIFLRRELLKLGCTGPKFNVPNNGQLYVFEKNLSA